MVIRGLRSGLNLGRQQVLGLDRQVEIQFLSPWASL